MYEAWAEQRRKERLLKQQAPETDRRKQRPSAEEWASLEHLQAPKASAAEWLAQQIPETLPKTLKQLQTVVGCCDVAGSRAESSGKRTRPHNDASLKDHDDNDGVEGVLLPVCSTGKRACFSLCEARAKRKGGANEGDALVEDSEDDPWPKLDISRQFFSSKEEPMILGDDPLAQVPAHVAKYLRDYQRHGVEFLYKKYRANTGGILGDDMGLGKTVQTAALLIAVLNKSCTQQDVEDSKKRRRHAETAAFTSSGSLTPCSSFTARKRKEELAAGGAEEVGGVEGQETKGPVLIVCPSSVVRQWKSELLTWAHFEVDVCESGRTDCVLKAVQNAEIEVMVCSYDCYKRSSGVLNVMDWEVVIFDECHLVKNPKSARAMAANDMRCKRRFGLTGTLLQNKMAEMYCTLSWAVPGALGPKSEFEQFYQDPILMGQKIDATPQALAKARERITKLNQLVLSHVLRREKDVIKEQMPGKDEYIVMCPMSEEQRKVYERVLTSDDYELLRKNQDPCPCGSMEMRNKCCYRQVSQEDFSLFYINPSRVDADGCISWATFLLPAITQLLKVCNHLDLVRVAQRDSEEKKKKDLMFAMTAFDAFDLGQSEVMSACYQSSNLSIQANDENCGKMRVLKVLLSAWYSEGDKVLLFSYSVRMLNILEKLLIAEGHAYQRLDGSTPPAVRLELCNKFNRTKETFVFLISTRAGGLGLNLTSANKVVIFDPNWNPSYDIQAQDRSFRIGQRRDVKVYRLISANSLEETIYQRQIYKQQTSNIVMHASHERRYFEGVMGKENGELFGIKNLLSVQKTTMLREREKECQLKYEIKLMEIEGGLGSNAAAAEKGGKGEGEADVVEGDDDEAWKICAASLVSEEAEGEGAGGGAGEGRRRGSPKKKELAGLGCEALFKTLDVHNHRNIVGESDKEVAMGSRARKMFPQHVNGGSGALGGADVKGRGKQAGAGAGAVARGSVLNVQELTSEQKKAHAIEIMKHNCQERLALSWEEFLEKCKQSSAEEKLELYRKIK